MTMLTVAAAQIACQPGDTHANLASHLAMIETARLRGVELLVFPELSLTGYLGEPDCGRLAIARENPALLLLASVAGEMALSVGFIERGAENRFFNAQALLAGGAVAAIHRKLNLPGYGRLRENAVYAKGETLDLVALGEGWRAATLICADAWNPALPWLAALAGATLLILPVASARGAVDGGFDNPRSWDVNLAHTALSYGLPTIFANHCGGGGDLDFWGGSRILDARGHVLAQAGEDAGLIVATLAPGDGVDARKNLPTIRDADPALIQRLLSAQLASARA
jgi:predicted amidohydrolase